MLFAAFEPQEVVAQLEEAGLSGLEVGVVSDRHLAVMGRLQRTDVSTLLECPFDGSVSPN